MLKPRYLLLARSRLADIAPSYSYGFSSMLPLCASSLFLYQQVRGFVSSKPSHRLPTLSGMRRALLFFLIGIGFLVLTACGGGDPEGSGSSGGNGGDSSPNPLEVDLTFAPISGGFRIGNHSDFGDMVSLNITATSGDNIEEKNINIGDFVDGSYDFTGLDDQSDWTFNITGILSDGGQREVKIVFVWDENEEDHRSGGIRAGLDTDGDRRANSVDEDDDNDEVADVDDNCPLVVNTQQTNTDLANDGGDACDEDDDACDEDDDNDGEEDRNEAAGCALAADCDNDGAGDGADIDDDGDGLIEITTPVELNAVRYALEGDGRRLLRNGVLNTDGCGGDGSITSCNGYELVTI